VDSLQSKTFNKLPDDSSETNHSLNATLAFTRLDLFIGVWRPCRVRRTAAASERVITKHLRLISQRASSTVAVIDPSPEASTWPAGVSGPAAVSFAHRVCDVLHNDHEGKVGTANTHRQTTLSTSILICRWDNVEDRQKQKRTKREVSRWK